MRPSQCDYLIYTDGGCARNPGGPGAYAAVIIDQSTGEITELTGGYRSTTNNRMEIMGAVAALEWIPEGASYFLYSDSQYLLNCFSGLWDRKKNRDLFDRLDEAARGRKGGTKWIRGHAGNPYNELCDRLCTETMALQGLPRDKGYRDSGKKSRKSEGGAMSVPIGLPPELAGKVSFTDPEDPGNRPALNRECEDGIANFCREPGARFRDYADLHSGGQDCWSRKKPEDLLRGVSGGEAVYDALRGIFAREKDILGALRWYRRGLTLTDSVRKVLVDREITENAVSVRRRRRK